jgi:hypothetical protein
VRLSVRRGPRAAVAGVEERRGVRRRVSGDLIVVQQVAGGRRGRDEAGGIGRLARRLRERGCELVLEVGDDLGFLLRRQGMGVRLVCGRVELAHARRERLLRIHHRAVAAREQQRRLHGIEELGHLARPRVAHLDEPGQPITPTTTFDPMLTASSISSSIDLMLRDARRRGRTATCSPAASTLTAASQGPDDGNASL